MFVNKAYIVLADSVEPTDIIKQEIWDKLKHPSPVSKEQLKEYEIPYDIEFIPKLPRKAGTEKIDYTYLEDMAIKKLI